MGIFQGPPFFQSRGLVGPPFHNFRSITLLLLFQAGASEVPPPGNKQQSIATDDDITMDTDEPHPRFTVGTDDHNRASSGADTLSPFQPGRLFTLVSGEDYLC